MYHVRAQADGTAARIYTNTKKSSAMLNCIQTAAVGSPAATGHGEATIWIQFSRGSEINQN